MTDKNHKAVFTDEDIANLLKDELKAEEKRFSLDFARGLISDSTLMDKNSTKEGSLGWVLLQTQKRVERLRGLEKIAIDPNNHETSNDRRNYLRKALDIKNQDPERFLNEALLAVVIRTRDYLRKHECLPSFKPADPPGSFGRWKYSLACELSNMDPDLGQKIYLHGLLSLKRKTPFNWDNFIETFEQLSLIDAYVIFSLETNSVYVDQNIKSNKLESIKTGGQKGLTAQQKKRLANKEMLRQGMRDYEQQYPEMTSNEIQKKLKKQFVPWKYCLRTFRSYMKEIKTEK